MRVPRTLVPENCPTPTGPPARPPKRLKTWLDSRTMIPQEMPVVPFADLKSNIPSHVPLAVLDNRVLISRDMPLVPFPPELAASTPTLTELDGRVVVPQAAHLEPTVEAEPFSPEVLQDLVESDLLVGGEPRLLPEKARRLNWDFLAPVFSIGFHLLLIVLFLTVPGLVGRYQVNPAEEAMNQQNLGYVYLPKNLEKIPKRLPEPREKPSDKMKIDVGELNKIAPPKPEVSREQGPSPQPAPRVTPPQPPPKQMAEAAPQPKAEQPAPPKPEPHLEPITPNRDHPTIAARPRAEHGFQRPDTGATGDARRAGPGGWTGARLPFGQHSDSDADRRRGFHELYRAPDCDREAKLVRRDAGIGEAGRPWAGDAAFPDHA
jgi:hypothetical protein